MSNRYNINEETILEDLVELLTNTVNMTSVFYDVFLNPYPMDVELQQFNDHNELITVVIPNRAKDRVLTKFGEGSPEGVVVAPMGTMYIDITDSSIYVKVSGTDEYGWVSLVSEESIIPIIRKYLIDNGYVTIDYLIEHGYITVNDHATSSKFGVVTYDSSSINVNSNGQLGTFGINDQNNNVKKIWVGLLSDYTSLSSKDSNTFYIITND